MWTEDNLMVLRPEDQQERDGFVSLLESSHTVGGWGLVVVRGPQGSGGVTHQHRGECEAFFIGHPNTKPHRPVPDGVSR